MDNRYVSLPHNRYKLLRQFGTDPVSLRLGLNIELLHFTNTV